MGALVSTHTSPDPFDVLSTVQAMLKPLPAPVYPGYIAMRIKKAMRDILPSPDRDFPGASVGDIQTIGDCRYSIPVEDLNGNKYRVTVEVVS